VLSALGIAVGARRRDAVRGVMMPLAELAAPKLRAMVPWPDRERGAVRTATCDLRYAGQGFELELPLEPLRTLAARFHQRHTERYGYADREGAIELVNLRAAQTVSGVRFELVGQPRTPAVAGPATVHLEGATLWVAPGWTARRRRDGAWRVTR
jgi:N-methylhydantoinase A